MPSPFHRRGEGRGEKLSRKGSSGLEGERGKTPSSPAKDAIWKAKFLLSVWGG